MKRLTPATYPLIKLFCLFLLTLAPHILKAQQSKLDSLQNQLRVLKTDSAKVPVYELLIREYQSIDPPKAYALSNEFYAFAVAKKLPEGVSASFFQKGIYHLLKGKYDSLKFYADKALKVAVESKKKKYEAMALNLTATYFWHTGKPDSSLSYHLRALKIRETIKDIDGIGTSYLGLGSLYISLNKLAEARSVLDKAIAIGYKNRNDRLLINSMHMKANIFGMTGKYHEALAIDTIALKIALRTNNKRGLSQIYSNMANCYSELNLYETSIAYHAKVLEIDQFFGDEKQIGDTYYNMASVYAKIPDYPKAINLSNKALALFKNTGYKEGSSYTYKLLSDVYSKAGNYAMAYNAEKNYNLIQKELFNERSDKTISELKTQYETEKKEQQIKSLNQKSTIQKLQIRQRNFWLVISAIVLVLGGLLAWVIYNRNKLKEKARMQEEINRQQELAARAVLDAEERERRRIATDLHDGVGQLLSAALMNLNGLFGQATLNHTEKEQAERSVALVTESYDEMRSISHQIVPNALVRAGLASAVKEFLNKIDQQKLKVSLETVGLNERLDEQTETVLYRVIQETVNNVIKHANASKLNIQLIRDEDGIAVTIEDNGKGFDKELLKKSTGIGMSNILSRIEFLKGTMDIDTAPGKGTLIAIHIPETPAA